MNHKGMSLPANLASGNGNDGLGPELKLFQVADVYIRVSVAMNAALIQRLDLPPQRIQDAAHTF
jgi:hypothetical protein